MRDVQRNLTPGFDGQTNDDVSIRCRARRTAEPPFPRSTVSSTFLFAVVRDVQRNLERPHLRLRQRFLFAVVRDVQRNEPKLMVLMAAVFLFAVVRDVQRNSLPTSCPTTCSTSSFCSLSCETYSGTVTQAAGIVTATLGFYSLSCETYSGTSPVEWDLNA